AARPDVVLMHLGTNDMWGGSIPVDTVLAAYTKLIGQMRAENPDMKIVVAQIIPMNPPGCATCAAEVVALDNAIPGWAAGLTTAAADRRLHRQLPGRQPVVRRLPGRGHHPQHRYDHHLALDRHSHLRRRPAGHPVLERHPHPGRGGGHRPEPDLERRPRPRR